MPNRYIRASAIESEAVNALSWEAEVFYRRLLNRADDFGRFTANPKLLRASLFPLRLDRVTDADILRLLTECEKVGLLFQYAVSGKDYLILNKWEKGRAHKSDYPPPHESTCSQMQTYVYTCSQMSPTPTPTPTPITDTDLDTDNTGVFAESLQTDAFKAKWAEYVAYRRQAKFRTLKPASITKLAKQLAEWGHDVAIASIDETIRNGWQGLFEPKAGAGGVSAGKREWTPPAGEY